MMLKYPYLSGVCNGLALGFIISNGPSWTLKPWVSLSIGMFFLACTFLVKSFKKEEP